MLFKLPGTWCFCCGLKHDQFLQMFYLAYSWASPIAQRLSAVHWEPDPTWLWFKSWPQWLKNTPKCVSTCLKYYVPLEERSFAHSLSSKYTYIWQLKKKKKKKKIRFILHYRNTARYMSIKLPHRLLFHVLYPSLVFHLMSALHGKRHICNFLIIVCSHI